LIAIGKERLSNTRLSLPPSEQMEPQSDL